MTPTPPSKDIYAAGCPCTPFSRLSSKRKREDYDPFANDERTRPLIEAARHIRRRRPKSFILEQVWGSRVQFLIVLFQQKPHCQQEVINGDIDNAYQSHESHDMTSDLLQSCNVVFYTDRQTDKTKFWTSCLGSFHRTSRHLRNVESCRLRRSQEQVATHSQRLVQSCHRWLPSQSLGHLNARVPSLRSMRHG